MKIEEWLNHCGISISQFSELCGVPKSSISYYIGGLKPTMRIAKKIQKATKGGVTIKDLRPDDE